MYFSDSADPKKDDVLLWPNAIHPGMPYTLFEVWFMDGYMKRKTIAFPTPGNVSTNDAASFGQKELGVGNAIKNVIQKVAGGGTINEAMQDISAANKITKAEAAAIGLDVTGITKGAASVAEKVLVNPNTVTTFTSNGIRQYTYSFKMVPESKEDAKLIIDIINAFRHHSYAGLSGDNENSLFLRYPPVWIINHMYVTRAADLINNVYLPRAYACYLTNVSATQNASAAGTYYDEGAPVETDLQLTFMETRALFQSDIEELRKGTPLIVSGKSVKFLKD